MVALLCRVGGGGGGGVLAALTSALTLRGGRWRSDGSSAFVSSASAALVLPPLRVRHCPQIALIFPSPPPPSASQRRRHLSCLSPQEETGSSGTAAVAADDEVTAIPAPPASDPVREAAAQLDLRVGRVLRAWRHPEAESLYVEEVDVGEAEPRTICSGLVGFVPLEVLQGAPVVVLANLKPRNMRGVKSNGMLLAASDAAHETVELLAAPEGAVPGERIWFGGEDHREEQPDPATPNQVKQSKDGLIVNQEKYTRELLKMGPKLTLCILLSSDSSSVWLDKDAIMLVMGPFVLTYVM